MAAYQNESVQYPALAEPVSLEAARIRGRAVVEVIRTPELNAEERLQARERAAAIRQFVLSLEPRDQRIVLAVFWMGMSQADVARELGVSRMAICKAMKKISAAGRKALAHVTDYDPAN